MGHHPRVYRSISALRGAMFATIVLVAFIILAAVPGKGQVVGSCGFSVGHEGLIAGETVLGALPGASLAIPEALGLTADAGPAVNAYLAAPGVVITTLEPAINRQVLGKG
jgi:hypothetical protein